MNRHEFQQAAQKFRAGRLALKDFMDQALGDGAQTGSGVFSGQTVLSSDGSLPGKDSRPLPSGLPPDAPTPGKDSRPLHPVLPSDAPSPGKDSRPLKIDGVTLDLDRAQRCGFPEVVFGLGKSAKMVRQIVERLIAAGQPVLVTRIDDPVGRMLAEQYPSGVFNSTAHTFRLDYSTAARQGSVAIVTAGSSDLPVAEEAAETLAWMNVESNIVVDVGVAGPQRLQANLGQICERDAVIVVAGFEGALPSVVGGYVDCPIIAVPTSIGYGANLNGIAALLGMLNSCAANVAVVNIDAGFKAGYLAGMIARKNW